MSSMFKMKAIRDACDGTGIPGRFGPYTILHCEPWTWPLVLSAKLHEEAEEIRENMSDVREYADLIQVAYDLAALRGISISDIEKARILKLHGMGGFTQRKVLIRDEYHG